jgi:hypothetical protein
MKRLNLLVVCCSVACLTACGGVTSSITSLPKSGYFKMEGTPRGIQAYSDHQNGLIAGSKASKEVPSTYWQHRREQEETQRQSIWSKVANSLESNNGREAGLIDK